WGNEEERARSERIARHAQSARVPEKQSLQSLARVLREAELVVGVDTGLVHLAAALGAPTISLFVATNPALAVVAHVNALARDLGALGRVRSAHQAQHTAQA